MSSITPSGSVFKCVFFLANLHSDFYQRNPAKTPEKHPVVHTMGQWQNTPNWNSLG